MTDLLLGATTLTCGECGIAFAVPDRWYNEKRNDHTTWYCPNGHRRHFSAKSEAEGLREQLEAEQRRTALVREWALSEQAAKQGAQRRAVALRGVVTRTKRRIASGKCPCCKARFSDLAAHMQGEHPGYGAEETASA